MEQNVDDRLGTKSFARRTFSYLRLTPRSYLEPPKSLQCHAYRIQCHAYLRRTGSPDTQIVPKRETSERGGGAESGREGEHKRRLRRACGRRGRGGGGDGAERRRAPMVKLVWSWWKSTSWLPSTSCFLRHDYVCTMFALCSTLDGGRTYRIIRWNRRKQQRHSMEQTETRADKKNLNEQTLPGRQMIEDRQQTLLSFGSAGSLLLSCPIPPPSQLSLSGSHTGSVFTPLRFTPHVRLDNIYYQPPRKNMPLQQHQPTLFSGHVHWDPLDLDGRLEVTNLPGVDASPLDRRT